MVGFEGTPRGEPLCHVGGGVRFQKRGTHISSPWRVCGTLRGTSRHVAPKSGRASTFSRERLGPRLWKSRHPRSQGPGSEGMWFPGPRPGRPARACLFLFGRYPCCVFFVHFLRENRRETKHSRVPLQNNTHTHPWSVPVQPLEIFFVFRKLRWLGVKTIIEPCPLLRLAQTVCSDLEDRFGCLEAGPDVNPSSRPDLTDPGLWVHTWACLF